MQYKYLRPRLKGLLCNTLIQSLFDYGCKSWNLKHKLQTTQNKYMRLCLNLSLRSHIGAAYFRKINWLPVSERVESCIATNVFKYWNRIVPSYTNDMFKPSYKRYNTRSQMALDIPLQKNTHRTVSFFFSWTENMTENKS